MTDALAQNLQMQRELYGAPIGDLVREALGHLGISQAHFARTIGLSAPMLSQLSAAQRVKIGNPAVLHRMEAVLNLAAGVAAGRVPAAQIADQLTLIAAQQGSLTTEQWRTESPDLGAVVAALRGTGEDLTSAAAALRGSHPRLAQLLDAAAADAATSTRQ